MDVKANATLKIIKAFILILNELKNISLLCKSKAIILWLPLGNIQKKN